MAYEKDIVFTPEQQEALAQLVNDRLRAFDWTRKEAAENANIAPDKVSVLSRTAPAGMPYGYFLKVMLILDIDLYQVCKLLGLTEEVEKTMKHWPDKYPNARRGLSQESSDPLTALISTLPAQKQAQARSVIEAVLKSI
ncbi:hypothetical protein [Ktedonospora formicarum]|uniref:Uncharacterized protein n=1 Tax=Ktedonospora formicarum TaxID=2778364 RepID=A0A8J3I5M6_9CHLR|nr:hypothetical protein [Ktedonospora formicarum]GHO45204.1 hypothetical protein KSX_33670 [Ktedonospora formicarum]